MADDVSSALAKAVADGGARTAEEAAALAAVVTVPMRVRGSQGWAAAKTAAFGGRVIGSRSRLSPEQLEVLWLPIQGAIPLASLGALSKSRRLTA
jgi:starvation-inducible outer membrane lipoprotein